MTDAIPTSDANTAEAPTGARPEAGPVLAGYMYGCKATMLQDCPGDPSMVLSVPVEQWLTDYVFLVDYSYTSDKVKLVFEELAEAAV